MPSQAVLEQKQQIVAVLTEKLKGACVGVLVDYKGINVADDTKLRKSMREAGVDYFVVKNTLLRLAAQQAGLTGIEAVLEGTTALALSTDDYVAAAKILCEYAEKNETFHIKLGFIDQEIIDADGVKSLAKLPSREELVARALGGLNAPISGFVHVLNANLQGLVRALDQIAQQKSA